MPKNIKEERLTWVLPVARKEIELVDAAKVCPHGKRTLKRWVSLYKKHGEAGIEGLTRRYRIRRVKYKYVKEQGIEHYLIPQLDTNLIFYHTTVRFFKKERKLREEIMARTKFLVLGAGLIGFEITRCLSEEGDITVVDRSERALAAVRSHIKESKCVCADFLLDARQIQALAYYSDVVVGAIDPSIAYTVLTQAAAAGTPIVDISFYSESPLSLNAVAEHFNTTIAVDCGVAPV